MQDDDIPEAPRNCPSRSEGGAGLAQVMSPQTGDPNARLRKVLEAHAKLENRGSREEKEERLKYKGGLQG